MIIFIRFKHDGGSSPTVTAIYLLKSQVQDGLYCTPVVMVNSLLPQTNE